MNAPQQATTTTAGGLEASQYATTPPDRHRDVASGGGSPGGGGCVSNSQAAQARPQPPLSGLPSQRTTANTDTLKLTIQKNLKTLTEQIQSHLDSQSTLSPSPTLLLLQQAQQALLYHALRQEESQTLQEIQKTLQSRLTPTTATPKTWAQTAQIGHTMPRPQPQASMTISVKMGNQEEREAAKKMSHDELRRKLGVQQFKAVQNLPN